MYLHHLLTRALATLALLLALPAVHADTMIRLHTSQGPIDFQLYDSATPKSVANFLAYVRSGAYANTFIHRSVASFVVQGGGYAWPSTGYAGHITPLPPVVNEFSATRSNLRGTVAMAKVGVDVGGVKAADSATSEWFVNLADNASNLDNQNGGFTVFARVTTPGMAVVDKIAALPTIRVGSFDTLPVANLVGTSVLRSNVVLITEVTEFPPLASQSVSDRIFNYLEAAYPQYLAPSRGEAGTGLGYIYRYYAGSNAYVGTQNGKVDYLVPSISPEIGHLGTVADWLAIAQAAGY